MPKSKTSTSQSSSSFWDHPITTIEEALSLRKQIERLQGQLTKTLGSTTSAISGMVTGKSTGGGRRKVSSATLRKMRAAQQARWAKIKGPSAKPTSSATSGGASKAAASTTSKKTSSGGGMTAEQRAKIAATMKARWAAKRKGGATAASSGSAAASKSAASSAPKKKGTLTPEGRAKLAAAMKARWAAKKKGGNQKPAVGRA